MFKKIWKKIKWKVKNIMFNLFHKKENEKNMKQSLKIVSSVAAAAAKARTSRLKAEENILEHERNYTLKAQMKKMAGFAARAGLLRKVKIINQDLKRKQIANQAATKGFIKNLSSY